MKILMAMTALLLFVNPIYGQQEGTFIYNDKGKRDPFVPLVDENGRYLLDEEGFCSFDSLSLSGILWDPQGKSSALINNQIVKIGDSIGGFKISNVTKNSVTLFKDGEEYIMRLSISEDISR